MNEILFPTQFTLSLSRQLVETPGRDCASDRLFVSPTDRLLWLHAGRPLTIEPLLTEVDALVVAWLPGSEGAGVADLLFGDLEFTGRLPRTWFRTVSQLPLNVGDKRYDPLFPFGFGMDSKEQTLP